MVIGGILTYAYMAALEYFIGYLGVLMVLLFLGIPKESEDITRRKKVGLFLSRVFFPLMAGAIFLYWRFRIFVPKRAAVDNDLIFKPLMENPIQQAWIYLITLVRSSFETLVMAYIAPLLRQFSGLEARQIVINILVTCLLVGLMIWIGLQIKDRLDPRWQVKWIITGLLLIVIPLIPVVLVGREVRLTDDYNRYTLQSIPGVAITLTGLLFLFKNPVRTILLAILVAVSGLTLLNDQAQFAQRWDAFQKAWQQITLRAPGLEPGTVLAMHLPKGDRIAEGFEITAAANLIYSEGNFPTRPEMPQVVGEIINEITLPKITAQAVVERYTKTVPLSLDYSKILIFSQPSAESCVRLIDPRYPLSESDPVEIQAAAPFSHSGQVRLEANSPQLPPELFTRQTSDDWCSFYQKADLAAQRQDWAAVVALHEQVTTRGLKPADVVEWIPFYLGYIKQGLSAEAEPIRQELLKSEALISSLCTGTGFDLDLVRGICSGQNQ